MDQREFSDQISSIDDCESWLNLVAYSLKASHNDSKVKSQPQNTVSVKFVLSIYGLLNKHFLIYLHVSQAKVVKYAIQHLLDQRVYVLSLFCSHACTEKGCHTLFPPQLIPHIITGLFSCPSNNPSDASSSTTSRVLPHLNSSE
jgi:hypothetical protein